MPSVNILKESNVIQTPRVLQMAGLFDVPLQEKVKFILSTNIEFPESWNVGLIVGPSGCGKSTVARELFGEYMNEQIEWGDNSKSILDYFPASAGIKDIVAMLSSVGFSSPPSWVKPFGVLSTGEQFRVNIARALMSDNEVSVIDEFTSVVDRSVAKIASSAIQKTVRRYNKKIVAVSCHYDILDWLEPDWVYQPATNQFYSGRYLHQRPKITLEIRRVESSMWDLFRQHHYLDSTINKSARCFCAYWDDIPVAFTSVLHFPHPKRQNTKREHRTVVLPDYQGIGIGKHLSNYMGSVVTGLGYSYITTTSHPIFIKAKLSDKEWRMTRQPSRTSKGGEKSIRGMKFSFKRLTASFEYIGKKMNAEKAKKIWETM